MVERKKVFVVYHFFAHYRGPIIEELIESGEHDYYFVGGEKDPYSSGIKAYEFGEDERFRKIKTWSFGRRIVVQSGIIGSAWLTDIDSIIFLGNSKFLMTWIGAIVGRLRGKKIYFWTHGWHHPETGLKDFVRNRFYKLAHSLLLYGNHAKQIGVNNGYDPANLYVIYNSLDYKNQVELRGKIQPEALRNFRSELFSNPDKPIVFAIGRLRANKRFDLLIEAAAKIIQSGRDVNLLLVGEGEAEASLKELAEKLNVSVCFYGACYEEEVLAKLIMCASVTVSPGNVGLMAMHSLVYGTPVITHADPDKQMPEFEAVIDGVTGSFYEFGNTDALVKHIIHWIDLPYDDLETKRNCYEVIDKYYNPQSQRVLIDEAISGAPASISSSLIGLE